MIPSLIERVALDPEQTTALMCGPEAMMRFCARSLAKRGVLWELVRLQEERVASSPPIAAYLLIYEIDAHDEAATEIGSFVDEGFGGVAPL